METQDAAIRSIHLEQAPLGMLPQQAPLIVDLAKAIIVSTNPIMSITTERQWDAVMNGTVRANLNCQLWPLVKPKGEMMRVASSEGRAGSAVSDPAGEVSAEAAQTFQQNLTEMEQGKGRSKRTADQAGLPDLGGAPPRRALPGTHAAKSSEQKSLQTSGTSHQSEHPLGYAAAHPDVERKSKEGRATENSMPAYQEVLGLHRDHAGTGTGTRPLGREGTGWDRAENYRQDQKAVLHDPVARHEGTTLSNAYQLNQLGYAQQMAHSGKQFANKPVHEDTQKSNLSYANMIKHDQPQKYRVNGSEVMDRLGPHGQAESLLAREMAHSGQWPTPGRTDEALAQYGADPEAG